MSMLSHLSIDLIHSHLSLKLLGRPHVPLLLGVDGPDGAPEGVGHEVELEQDLWVGALGPAPELLVLESVPSLLAGLHPQQRDGQLAQELESERRSRGEVKIYFAVFLPIRMQYNIILKKYTYFLVFIGLFVYTVLYMEDLVVQVAF